MRITLLLLVTVAVAACGSGSDDMTDGEGYPEASIEVTIEHPEAEAVSYRVTCDGDLATVDGIDLDGDTACAALADSGVRSRLLDEPSQDQVCTEIYGGPDVATITGSIEGQSVDTQVDRANGCGISDWDDLLGDLLPPALGVTG